MSAQKVWPVVRDVLCFATGLGGIVYQQLSRNISADLLLTYLALITTPGGVALWQLRRAGKPEPIATTESSSPSPSQPSSSSS